jgi:hypothetical protein
VQIEEGALFGRLMCSERSGIRFRDCLSKIPFWDIFNIPLEINGCRLSSCCSCSSIIKKEKAKFKNTKNRVDF